MGSLADRFSNRLPFVVGVTGHRSISPDEEERLAHEVDRVLSGLRAKLVETPLLMLCGMASGADLLCAERAVAAGIPVCALLPTSLERYEADFSPEERSRLHAALDDAVEIRVLDDDVERGYVRLGAYIARYSHLVIALWDGVDSRGHGGTGDVVRMRIDGSLGEGGAAHPSIEIDAFPDVGPVVHLPTSRADGPPVAGPATTIYPPRFDGDTTAQRDDDAATVRLECFNRDLRRNAIGEHSLHEAVDALSSRLQRRIRLVTNTLYVLFAAATSVQIVRLSTPLQTLLLAAGLLLYALARRADVENRYQDYRALAEALRVRQAWALDGIAAPVDACYLRMHQSELQWIRLALRTVDLIDPVPQRAAAERSGACGRWLDGQWGFYARTRVREDRRSRRIATASRALIAAGGTCAALAWLLPQAVIHLHQRELAYQAVWFRLHGPTAFTLCSAWAAILTAYSGKFGFATNAKRYERMFLVFDVVKRRIAKLPPESTHEAEAMMLETGREALVEHADWLLQRRERPLTFTIQR